MKKIILLLLFSVFVIASCNKPSPPGEGSIDSQTPTLENSFIYFKIKSDLNGTYISQTINGSVYGSAIDLSLPDTVDVSHLIASFETKGGDVYVGGKKQESGETANDFTEPITFVVHEKDGSKKSYTVQVIRLSKVKSAVPVVHIDLDNGDTLDSRDHYVHGTMTIDGEGEYQDFHSLPMKIKGKGHQSWHFPKKSFKLKLENKEPLFGLPESKKWEFRALYFGQSLMTDPVAFEMAKLLGMPYANHPIPIEVYLNGEYHGSYCFTEKKEVNKSHIQGKSLLELDAYFDGEPWQFKSKHFGLPVQVHEPDLDDFTGSAGYDELAKIENSFNAFEAALTDKSFPKNNYYKYFDPVSLVNYLIVSNFTANLEVDGPKSVWMYQSHDYIYHFGPVWDYDNGFGLSGSHHFIETDLPLFKPGSGASGSNFFRAFLKDPYIRALYNQRWKEFEANGYDKLKEFINEYAHALDVSGAYERDREKWHRYKTKEADKVRIGEMKQDLLDWLDARKVYMDANGLQTLK